MDELPNLLLNDPMNLRTKRGYQFSEVSSAMQKGIRRGDAALAGYWALELWESGFGQYVWRRLLTVSAEDCWGILTQEVKARAIPEYQPPVPRAHTRSHEAIRREFTRALRPSSDAPENGAAHKWRHPLLPAAPPRAIQ